MTLKIIKPFHLYDFSFLNYTQKLFKLHKSVVRYRIRMKPFKAFARSAYKNPPYPIIMCGKSTLRLCIKTEINYTN